MDGGDFDSIARILGARSDRRQVFAVSIVTALAATFEPLKPHTDAKKHKRKRRRGSHRPPAPVRTCTKERPIVCGPGCCSPLLPLCCPDIRSVTGVSCRAPNESCCTLAEGGGACLPGKKCCPPTLDYPFDGSCNDPGAACCPSGTGGGFHNACPPGKACCPSSLSNLRNQGCCPALLPCCNVDGDCPGAHPCGADGCCEV